MKGFSSINACRNPCQLPLTIMVVSILGRSQALTWRMVNYSYCKYFRSYRGHQTSYICFRDSPIDWWPTIRCGLPSIKVQSLVDHCIFGATLQPPEPYQAIMPQSWANARRGCVFRLHVDSAGRHPSPLYPPRTLCGAPTVPSNNLLVFSYKSGPHKHFSFSRQNQKPATTQNLHNFHVWPLILTTTSPSAFNFAHIYIDTSIDPIGQTFKKLCMF